MDLLNSDLYYDYINYPETKQCYTDGRYFKSVFESYPGYCSEPIHVNVTNRGKQSYVDRYMRTTHYNTNYPTIIRIITTLTESNYSHSSLLIIEPTTDDGTNAILFDAVELDQDSQFSRENAEEMVSKLCEVILEYLTPKFPKLTITMDLKVIPKKHSDCRKSGYCNSHVIMYAICYLKGYKYDSDSIKRFASLLENNYKLCPCKEPDIQYGAVDNRVGGALLGGLAGGVIGGAIGGPTGMAIGAGTGIIGGYAIGGLV